MAAPATHETTPAVSATEGTIYIPFRRGQSSTPPKPRTLGGYYAAWDRCRKRINKVIFDECQDAINQLVTFVQQPIESQEESDLGIHEIPTAIVAGRDRALLSALVSQVMYTLTHPKTDESVEGKGKQRERAEPLIVQLDESDCSNTTSALRALVMGFLAQFDDSGLEVAVRKATSTSLAPFDMARLVAGYDECYSSRDFSPKLVVVLDRLEAYGTNVLEDLIYSCSKYLDSLPFVFVTTLAETFYLQRAFTTATRAMLDPTVFRPPSGATLCSDVVQKALYSHDSPHDVLLGETSIKTLKDVIDKTDGRIEPLITTLQLIYMEHYRYQGPLLEAVPTFHNETDQLNEAERLECIKKVEQADQSTRDTLMALLFIYKRKDPLSDGFRITHSPDIDKTLYTPESAVDKLYAERQKTVKNMRSLCYALNLLYFMTWKFDALGAYQQEIPLGFLDLLDLEAKGGDQLEKYAVWMLKKGFEFTNGSPDQDQLVKESVFNFKIYGDQDCNYFPATVYGDKEASSVFYAGDAKELGPGYARHISTRCGLRHSEPYRELYYTESSSGLKEVLDPAPRGVILSALIRPGAYFNCDCCDPEDSYAPESMAQRPDTSILFQRSLDGGRLLNLADWLGAFVGVVQHEQVDRTSNTNALTSGGHSLRARKKRSVDPDADGEEDTLEIQKEWQARFVQSAHELEFLGLIQATGRRKEHVMRTVFETKD